MVVLSAIPPSRVFALATGDLADLASVDALSFGSESTVAMDLLVVAGTVAVGERRAYTVGGLTTSQSLPIYCFILHTDLLFGIAQNLHNSYTPYTHYLAGTVADSAIGSLTTRI